MRSSTPKLDVGNIIVVTRQREVLLEWNSQQVHKNSFSAPQNTENETIRADAKEIYLAYILSNKAQGQVIN